MSGTNHNPYPTCIKCGEQLSPQDSRGWENLKPDDAMSLVWLCPKCILESEAIKDAKEHYQRVINDLQNQLVDVYNAVKVLQNIQPQAMGASYEKETSEDQSRSK